MGETPKPGQMKMLGGKCATLYTMQLSQLNLTVRTEPEAKRRHEGWSPSLFDTGIMGQKKVLG